MDFTLITHIFGDIFEWRVYSLFRKFGYNFKTVEVILSDPPIHNEEDIVVYLSGKVFNSRYFL